MPIPNQQWKYLLIGEDYDVRGTDSEKVAKEAALGGADIVVNLSSCVILEVYDDEISGTNIAEQTDYVF